MQLTANGCSGSAFTRPGWPSASSASMSKGGPGWRPAAALGAVGICPREYDSSPYERQMGGPRQGY
eukprot:7511498-Pyramimonas_sp.AAC.1